MAASTGKTKAVSVAGLDSTTRLVAWALLGLTLLLDAGVIALMISTDFLNWEGAGEGGFGGASQYFQIVILTLEPLITVVLGIAILFRAANRRMGWLIMALGSLGSFVGFTELYSAIAFGVQPEAAMLLRWPLAWLVRWLWLLWLILLGVVMPQVFPTGAPLGGRWRRLFQGSVLYMAASTAVLAFARMPLEDESAGLVIPNPLGLLPLSGEIVFPAVMIPLLIFGVLGIISLGVRFRRSRGDERQQIKWIFYALAVLVVSYWIFQGLEFLTGDEDSSIWGVFGITVWRLGRLGLPLSIGFSILKYRLYDIDLIINRTLVYGTLTLIIVLGYVLLVSGLGALLPGGMGLLPSLIATGILAVLFAPLRDRLQRGANRLVFGERERPYDVMRTLGAHLETTSGLESVLAAIAQTIAKSLKFPYVSITLQRANDFDCVAEFGSRRLNVLEIPLYHQARLIGYLAVCPRDGEKEMAEQDRELLHHIALWLGPVAHASTLTQELRQSHTRLVSARAEERRRLYRDLHDGLGPTLASQTLRFDHALELLPGDPQAATRILSDLKEQTQGLVLEIRRLVYALRSSNLDELGLLGSLREAIEGFRGSANSLQISLEGDEQALRQLPAAHEQAVERIALEALTNVVRHANANCCRLILELQEGPPPLLQMTIEDDGRGLPPGYSPGVGLASMIERAETLGGSVKFEPNRPQGTRVVASLPLPNNHPSSERQ